MSASSYFEFAFTFGWLSLSCRRSAASVAELASAEAKPQRPDEASQVPEPAPPASSSAEGHNPASLPTHTIYVVRRWPGRPDREGAYEGAAAAVWSQLVRLMPNQRLVGSGVLVKKAVDWREAQEHWETKRHLRAEDSPAVVPRRDHRQLA